MNVVETAFPAATYPTFCSLLSVPAQCEGHPERDREALRPFLDIGPDKRQPCVLGLEGMTRPSRLLRGLLRPTWPCLVGGWKEARSPVRCS